MTDDIEKRLSRLERIIAGMIDEEPASERRSSLPPHDGRLIKTTGRDKQLNVNATQELIDLVNEVTERFEMSKAEFAEEAFRNMAADLSAEDSQPKRVAVRTTQINFRCSPAFRELAHGMARHLDCSIADVMERALGMLAEEVGYEDSCDEAEARVS